MKLEPIVLSLLDTDLYKFNMDQVIFHKHTDLCGQYYFKCRNKDVVFTPEMADEIKAQVDHLCSLRFSNEELDYLRSIRFIKNDYVEFLRLWYPIRDYVSIDLNADGELSVVVDGPLFSAMQFEIYLLEIINEVYFRMAFDYEKLRKSAEERLDAKIKAMNDGTYTFKFAEFGCRRRLSREWQDIVLRRFITETKNFVGTSNVYLAMKYNVTPIGTYAHEFVQMYQGIDSIPLAYTNHYAMKDWYAEYDDLVIAIREVSGLEEAIQFINTHGSHHTDSIVTENKEKQAEFVRSVDSADVFINASTRFADGYRFGKGAEVGISTGKIHARGPMGMEGLTSYKYVLVGHGQAVKDYSGKDARPYTHIKTDRRYGE